MEAPHFECADHVDHGDGAGDAERERVAADVAEGDPGDGGQAEEKGDEIEIAIVGVHACSFRSSENLMGN